MTKIGAKRTAAVAIGLAFALLAAGCGKSAPSGGGGLATSPPAAGGSSGGGPYGGGRYGGGSSSGTTSSPSAEGPVLTVTQTNFQFTPSSFTVGKGDTITVKDATTGTPHTFTISGQGIDVTNNPGQSQPVVIDLPPGTYPFMCRFHASQGMTGTLVVK